MLLTGFGVQAKRDGARFASRRQTLRARARSMCPVTSPRLRFSSWPACSPPADLLRDRERGHQPDPHGLLDILG
jgi:hypothetical protein